MTVTYSLDVSDARCIAFTRLLLRWRGSIYKLVLGELLGFAFLYYLILVVSLFALNQEQFKSLQSFCHYFRDWLGVVPITFVLGFFVTIVVTRWWNIFDNLPWPDRICVVINAYVRGSDEKGRLIRRAMVRYLNIMSILCLRCVSTSVKKRFPTIDHLVTGKILTEEEKELLEGVSAIHGNYFQPAFWFCTLAAEAREDGRIKSDEALKHILDELGRYRAWLGTLMGFDWVSIPLVYTQVVSLAIHMFFFGSLFGGQYIEDLDEGFWFARYFPFFTFVQFFFLRGWMKVAEVLLNPFGEDDDDFEVNYLIDRNIAVGFIMVDDLYNKRPPLVRDPHWNEAEPTVPYTEAAAETHIAPFLGSAAVVEVPMRTQQWAPEADMHTHQQKSPSGSDARSMREFAWRSRNRGVIGRMLHSRNGSLRSSTEEHKDSVSETQHETSELLDANVVPAKAVLQTVGSISGDLPNLGIGVECPPAYQTL